MKYNLKHLEDFGEKVIGPIQSDEALLIYSIVRDTRPDVILEFGFANGHSSINFLAAMPKSCKLYSFDIKEESANIAKKIQDDRFKFILKNQKKFEATDIDNNQVDLVFFDASHDSDLNIKTFNKVKSLLNPNALILVHDTGSWDNTQNENVGAIDGYYVNGYPFPKGYFLNKDQYIHQAGERNFVNYLRKNEKKFHQIHLHSKNTFRHGLTILQRSQFLPV